MTADSTARSCSWPGCDRPSVWAFVNIPELRVAVSGEPEVGDEFRVCEVHRPELARQLSDAIRQALRKGAARENFAPGEPEWARLIAD